MRCGGRGETAHHIALTRLTEAEAISLFQRYGAALGKLLACVGSARPIGGVIAAIRAL
jgi:hypothetical protein